MDEHSRRRQLNPARNANIISRLLLWWLNPLFQIGQKRRLEEGDLYDVLDDHSAKCLHERMKMEWAKENGSYNTDHNPSLFGALFRMFGVRFLLTGLLCLAEEVSKIASAVMIGFLIRYFDSGNGVSSKEAYLLASGISTCAILTVLTHHIYHFHGNLVAMRIKVALTALVYHKVLRLGNSAFRNTTSGQIINLLSNDVSINSFNFSQVNYLWISPPVALATLVLMWQYVGIASLVGVGLLLLSSPCQAGLGVVLGRLKLKLALFTDRRICLMNEIIIAIRVIKMYCWEKMFEKLVHEVRSDEMRRVKHYSIGVVLRNILDYTGCPIAVYCLVITVVLTENQSLAPETIFPALALLHILKIILFDGVSEGANACGDCFAAIKRIQTFILLEEISQSSPNVTHGPAASCPADHGVSVLNVSASWYESLPKPTLKDITVNVTGAELVAIIGPVGSGKSSLLMAMLGELPLISGSFGVTGKVAYVAQQPWVFSASVRQNILFGSQFDDHKYQTVLESVCLTKDIASFPNGDATLVGERGIVLSGGQKARISLARALYLNADVYLLDDPLSAVDTTVGKHIFERCIRGLLKTKPCIIVTHQLQYLKNVNKIIVMKKGAVIDSGTFVELSSTGVDFSSLLKREEGESVVTPDYQQRDNTQTGLSNDDTPSGLRETMLLQRTHAPIYSTKVVKHSNKKSNGIRYSAVATEEWETSPGNSVHDSLQSIYPIDLNIQDNFVPCFQEEETRRDGVVRRSVYIQYFLIGGGAAGTFIYFLSQVITQMFISAFNWWLAEWTTEDDSCTSSLQTTQQFNSTETVVLCKNTSFYLPVYSGLLAGVVAMEGIRISATYIVLITTGFRLHDQMFSALIRCPMKFFDTNPSGRILNRFSRDMSLIDIDMIQDMRVLLSSASANVGSVLISVIVIPWLLIPTAVLALIGIVVRHYFLKTSRDVKRLEATTRSPIYSHANATIQGLHTVRAFKAEETCLSDLYNHLDLNTSASFLYLAITRWFAIRLDLLVGFFITAISFASVLLAERLNGGLVGLVLTSAMSLMGSFQWTVRQSVETENQMTSVERVLEYTELPSEAALETKEEADLDPEWPDTGEIICNKACLSYDEGSPVVLKDLSFHIHPQDKIGIVGRTGAGKSSLITMLFRLSEPQGSLWIDGVDIMTLGLHDLRSKISIIPQDPVLFMGPIRRNLDPFNQYCDDDLWRALKQVELVPTISSLPGELDAEVFEGGSNFSVGERQLLCLARAMLKKNRILVVDEATANVDPRTDGLVQKSIREHFSDCTVLTIAHRLHTIVDSDRIMVLDGGMIKECDHAHVLLQNPMGMFSAMVEQTGDKSHLRRLALEAYMTRENVQNDKQDLQDDTEKE